MQKLNLTVMSIVLMAALLLGARDAPFPVKPAADTGIAAVAANAAASARTATIDCTKMARLTVVYALTRVAATAMTMTMSASVDGGTTYGVVQTLTISGGTITLTDGVWTKTVAASKNIAIDLNVISYDYVKLVFGATGGGATDYITVTAQGGAGQ